ncbi:T9SS type A sorting domain-containing protein [candidate division WOR-3 bacterium]|nr:T9SS type A sorting domain-containing protein [candidate division WOR-3 bacterium]
MADARRQTLVCTPNPCRGSAVLHWDGDMTRFRRGIGIVSPEPSIMSLRVYDASGRVVLHSSLDISNSSFPLDLRSLRAGIYIVRLTVGSNSVTDKLVIQR